MGQLLNIGETYGLDDILKHPKIWRIGQVPQGVRAGIPTGHPGLNAALPSHGWAQGEMTEMLSNEQGIGELSLLIPAMRQTTQAGRSVMLIAPPYLPFPAAWEAHGIQMNRVVLVRAEGQELLWATEQAARSGACGMVIAWASHHRRDCNYQALRRLQVAADNGNTALFLYRPANVLADASPAPTRIVLSSKSGELHVHIAKRRGALLADTLALDLHPPHWRVRTVTAAQEALQKRRGMGRIPAPALVLPTQPQSPLRQLSASQ